VAAAVARQEGDPLAFELADDVGLRRVAERGLDPAFFVRFAITYSAVTDSWSGCQQS